MSFSGGDGRTQTTEMNENKNDGMNESKGNNDPIYDENIETIDVGLKFRIDELSAINSVDQSYSIYGVMDYDWIATEKDKQELERLTNEDKLNEYEPHWIPHCEPKNAVEAEINPELWDTDCAYKIETINGVKYNVKRVLYKGTFKEPFELENFPFDVQDLSFVFGAMEGDHGKMVNFVPSRMHNGQFFTIEETYSALAEWDIVALMVDEELIHWKDVFKQYIGENELVSERIVFRAQVRRRSKAVMTRIIFWMFLLGLLSVAVYSIAPDDVADRLGFIITMILAIVAFQFVISSTIPQVTYLTLIDKYNLFVFISIMLATLETVVVGAHSTNFENADTIDSWSSFIYIGYYLIGNVIFIIYSYHKSKQELKKIGQKFAERNGMNKPVNDVKKQPLIRIYHIDDFMRTIKNKDELQHWIQKRKKSYTLADFELVPNKQLQSKKQL